MKRLPIMHAVALLADQTGGLAGQLVDESCMKPNAKAGAGAAGGGHTHTQRSRSRRHRHAHMHAPESEGGYRQMIRPRDLCTRPGLGALGLAIPIYDLGPTLFIAAALHLGWGRKAASHQCDMAVTASLVRFLRLAMPPASWACMRRPVVVRGLDGPFPSSYIKYTLLFI
jgi:hypothetical protein